MSELYELSALELLNGYRAKEFTPIEVVEACVPRITDVGSTINAHWYLASESALVQARESSARWSAGSARPLDGVPVGVKDVIDVAGMPCTRGAPEHSIAYRIATLRWYRGSDCWRHSHHQRRDNGICNRWC